MEPLPSGSAERSETLAPDVCLDPAVASVALVAVAFVGVASSPEQKQQTSVCSHQTISLVCSLGTKAAEAETSEFM